MMAFREIPHKKKWYSLNNKQIKRNVNSQANIMRSGGNKKKSDKIILSVDDNEQVKDTHTRMSKNERNMYKNNWADQQTGKMYDIRRCR